MRLTQSVPEDVMVALFLRTEINSFRFRELLSNLLQRENVDRRMIDHPDLQNAAENALRAHLLGEFRGYQRDGDVFTGFPDHVEWWWGVISRADMERVKYINDDYWTTFSGGTRFVRDAAQRITAGEMEDVAAGYHSLAQSLAGSLLTGPCPPEPILLDNPKTDELVILEGHVRMTAYLLLPSQVLPELTVLIGRSECFYK